MDSFSGSTVIRRQAIDANQLQKLCLTLGRTTLDGKDISNSAPAVGTPVPPGYHLVYFTSGGTETELGADGTDVTFNSPAPFTRRMWAGGKMKWPATSQMLRVGDEVEERTRLVSATAKKSRSVGDMVLVEVEKEIWGTQGRVLIDQRSWVFRPELKIRANGGMPRPSAGIERSATVIEDIPGQSQSERISAENALFTEADLTVTDFPTRQLRWSPVGLFRFSALTFNGHKIHYNEDWAQTIEGHPNVVVHGPLNLINMLNYWQDMHGQGNRPREIKYRAMAPLYAEDTYQIRTGEIESTDQGQTFEILVEKEGVLCMKGEVTS